MTRKLLIAGILATIVGLMGLGLASAASEPSLSVAGTYLLNEATTVSHLPVLAPRQNAPGASVSLLVTGTVTGTVPLTNTGVLTPALKVVTAITDFFSGTVTATNVISMHNSGWGFGEIFKLYSYAQQSGKTPEEIEAMREDGMGWGQISKELGLAPGNKGMNLGGAVSGRNMKTAITKGAKSTKDLFQKALGQSSGDGSMMNGENSTGTTTGPGRGNGNGRGNGKGKGK